MCVGNRKVYVYVYVYIYICEYREREMEMCMMWRTHLCSKNPSHTSTFQLGSRYVVQAKNYALPTVDALFNKTFFALNPITYHLQNHNGLQFCFRTPAISSGLFPALDHINSTFFPPLLSGGHVPANTWSARG